MKSGGKDMKAMMTSNRLDNLNPGTPETWGAAALAEARAILAVSEPEWDGWTATVGLHARGDVLVGGPWMTGKRYYRNNITLPIGTQELAESLSAFIAS